MKLFTKISLVVAAVAGGLGILAIIIGLAMGADIYELNDMGIHLSPNQRKMINRVSMDIVEEKLVTEVEEEIGEVFGNYADESFYSYNDVMPEYQENLVEYNYVPTEENIMQHHSETGHNDAPNENDIERHDYMPDEANITHHKERHHNEKLHNYTCEFDDIKRLEVDVQNAKITIFAVESEKEFTYYSNRKNTIAKVDGSTLKLEDNSNIKDKIELELYIPVGVLKEIEIEAINGTVLADKIVADNVTIEIDNASVQIDELVVEDKAELQINAGQMIVGFYSGTNLETECAMGSIMVVCEGKQDDYNYDVECGMGQIRIQEDTYSGIGKDIRMYGESNKSIKAECAMGEIILEFPNGV